MHAAPQIRHRLPEEVGLETVMLDRRSEDPDFTAGPFNMQAAFPAPEKLREPVLEELLHPLPEQLDLAAHAGYEVGGRDGHELLLKTAAPAAAVRGRVRGWPGERPQARVVVGEEVREPLEE
jgi:hypothetical protein